MHKKWANANKCPYCGRPFVVSTMLIYHAQNNQCGLFPQDWAETPPPEGY